MSVASANQSSPSLASVRPHWASLPDAAYLHIPFCRRRCHYCDFATGRGTSDLIERYVQELCRQIGQIPSGYPSLQTIFFGGGTPSLLSADQVSRILSMLERQFGIEGTAEISLEANPGTVTRAKLAGYRAAGVNRISLGVQAFQPELLEACGRIHTVDDTYRAIADLGATGFDNINIDLIFGLPHQTMTHWQQSLAEVVAIAPPHVSLYDLTVESGTRFGRLYQPGSAPLPSEATTVDMYLEAISTLNPVGYCHYEVSNFAQPGHDCRHNRIYWLNRSYHGLGMGAVGYVDGRRYEQPKVLAEYFDLVDRGQMPTAPTVSMRERLADTLMLGLRLREGLAISDLVHHFGAEAVATIGCQLSSYCERGWVQYTDDTLALVPPEGWLFSNSILVDLLDWVESLDW